MHVVLHKDDMNEVLQSPRRDCHNRAVAGTDSVC